MKGLLTPRQLRQIEKDRYDLYEVLVAKHMWHVIRRELPFIEHGTRRFVMDIKGEIADEYDVKWIFNCLLCEMYRTSSGCNGCPLGDCNTNSIYDSAERGSVLACTEIIEAIEKDAKERGVYD